MTVGQFAVLLAIISIATGSKASIWNAATDFTGASNPNGAWTYGYYSLYGAPGIDLPPDPLTLIELTSSDTGSNYVSWFTPTEISVLSIIGFTGQSNLIMTAGLAPSVAFYAPVVRWTAQTSGQHIVEADFEYSGLGAGRTAQVGLRIDNTTVAYAYIGGPDGSLHIDENMYLSIGQNLDFFVAKGQTAIALDAQISTIPEPSSLLLSLASLLLVFGLSPVRRRLVTNRDRSCESAI